MKMSDYFKLPVNYDIDICKVHAIGHNAIEAKVINLKVVCHAINNHDRLVEENKRLREFVKRVADGDSACELLRTYMVHSYIHSAVRILEELEGGEECAK